MNKKLGLRMAQGGLVQGDERAALYAKYGIKLGGSAPAAAMNYAEGGIVRGKGGPT